MKLTLFLISTAALALETPIIPTMVFDLPSIATSTDDLLPNTIMPTIVKTPLPFATPTDDPLPTSTEEPLLPTFDLRLPPPNWPFLGHCFDPEMDPDVVCGTTGRLMRTLKEKLGM
jgi:hypothetical protein